MNYILDTNILILLVKSRIFAEFFDENYFSNTDNTFFYTHITLGEIDSISKQNQWGQKRLILLKNLLKGFNLVKSTSIDVVQNYGTIDAYSQGKLKNNPLPIGMSARNMGKNDLWIAASAIVLKATLLTTDKDFDHLSPNFINIDLIDISTFY
ncbi:PIN domain-containing protein [Bernardetia sp. Wsw4-3y2]|uniref:type II toxin-antitoxin system VapC family toxin n=1 Tax=unclassified Bernardetia TaxID=2647129 RepID=UPI0030D0D993